MKQFTTTLKQLKHLIKLDWVFRENGKWIMQKGQYEGYQLIVVGDEE